MKDLDQARNVLLIASKDYQALTGMQDPAAFPTEVFGFHVQQAVEKAFKAWLCCLGVVFPKIHDLDELAAVLRDAGAVLPEQFVPLLEYADFAVAFRYDVLPDLSADIDRSSVTHQVRRLLGHVETVLRDAEAREH